jgi:hypothetical protein
LSIVKKKERNAKPPLEEQQIPPQRPQYSNLKIPGLRDNCNNPGHTKNLTDRETDQPQLTSLQYTNAGSKQFSLPYEPQLKGSLFKTINDLI